MAATDAIDYSDAANWLALPRSPDKAVDVFYLYPTAYQKSSDGSTSNIAEINSPSMTKGAQGAYARQATAFDPVANIYAPYYRQADATYTLNLPLAEQDQVISGTPTADATAAFAAYIDHHNNGRPFILAGHSQGSNVLLFLLSGYMKQHPTLYQRMIAAYIVGYSVTPDFLSSNAPLRFAERADDTRVLISWNTEAPTIGAPNPVVHPGALAINPITWTRSEEPATAEQNLGSLLPDDTGELRTVAHYADARVDTTKGVVICSTCDVAKLSPGGPGRFPEGVFHSYDYPFYYFNLRENAERRVAQFLGERR